MRNRIAWWVQFVLLMVTCAGIFVGAIRAHDHGVKRLAAEARDRRREAGAWLANYVEWTGVRLSVDHFIEAESHSGIDSEVWGLVEVSDNDFRALRFAVHKRAVHSPALDEYDGNHQGWIRLERERQAPAWWHPEAHPDAETLYLGAPWRPGMLFIYCKSDHRMYVLIFDV
jgi:hypothetical protein